MDNGIKETNWQFLLVEGWKGHFCPPEYVQALLDDASSRGHSLYGASNTPCVEASIDLPGMILQDRGFQRVFVGGRALDIPVTDFGVFWEELKDSEVRHFACGRAYRKMHGWMSCVIVPEEEVSMLLEDMERLLPTVRELAAEENRLFISSLNRLNADNVKVVSHKDSTLIQSLSKKAPLSGKPTNDKN